MINSANINVYNNTTYITVDASDIRILRLEHNNINIEFVNYKVDYENKNIYILNKNLNNGFYVLLKITDSGKFDMLYLNLSLTGKIDIDQDDKVILPNFKNELAYRIGFATKTIELIEKYDEKGYIDNIKNNFTRTINVYNPIFEDIDVLYFSNKCENVYISIEYNF